ncbi:MAG: hypothetical protein JW821_14400, partial [Deltaproteobacteria bacterium]|nr:hypothetical protein [Deltaproteobacteria bacterium]
ETFRAASVLLDQDRGFDLAIDHEETRQVLLMENRDVALEKIWTFDAEKLPWDPEKVEGNVGIPVSYRIRNAPEAGLGKGDLCGGKVRVFQQDGKGGTIFLGEDLLPTTPVGEEMKITIGDSRDIVVTQQKMKEDRINVRRNQKNQAVLYDTDERIKAIIENFKDAPASLTMIQHIPGQWDMEECNMRFERRDAYTLEFEIPLPPHGKQELLMHYHRRNVR